jgi:hypothetical protein
MANFLSRSQAYEQGLASPASYSVSRETPARPATWESDVLVPVGQSFFLALILSLAGAALAGGLASANEASPWRWAGLAFVSVFLIVWALSYYVILRDQRATLWTIETRIGRDLDGDGMTGRPDGHVILVNPPPKEDPGARLRRQFAEFVHGCETDTSARRWEPQIGREKYQQWRDALIRMRYATWDNPENPRQGWHLTSPADEIVQRFQ